MAAESLPADDLFWLKWTCQTEMNATLCISIESFIYSGTVNWEQAHFSNDALITNTYKKNIHNYIQTAEHWTIGILTI